MKSGEFEYFNVAVTLTSNEDFIIIAGGYNNSYEVDDKIFVLDIRDKDEYNLYESDVNAQQKECIR